MFRELLYVGIALVIFVGILVLFQSFGSPSGALTGFAVSDSQKQTTTPLTGAAVAQEQSIIEQGENETAEQAAGASAQFQVQVRVIEP